MLLVGRSRDRFPVVSLDFSVTYSFRPYHGRGVDSAHSENEYQEHFLGVKPVDAWGWQPHHLHVPNVMEIWEPKPPGTLWATPGLLRDCFTFTKIRVYLYPFYQGLTNTAVLQHLLTPARLHITCCFLYRNSATGVWANEKGKAGIELRTMQHCPQCGVVAYLASFSANWPWLVSWPPIDDATTTNPLPHLVAVILYSPNKFVQTNNDILLRLALINPLSLNSTFHPFVYTHNIFC